MHKTMNKDVRLHTELYQACKLQIPTLCGDEIEFGILEIEYNPSADDRSDEPTNGRIIDCLIQKRTQLKTGPAASPRCESQVFQVLQHRYENIDLDPSVSAACHDDRVVWCANVASKPNANGDGGGDVVLGGVHQCLQSHMQQLSEDCRAAEFVVADRQAEDVRLDPFLRRDCGAEVATLCGKENRGTRSVRHCLERALIDDAGRGMNSACKQTVHARLRLLLQYGALDSELRGACRADMLAVRCGVADGRAHNETLACLADRQLQIKSADCAEVVSVRLRAQAADIDFDSQMLQECATDLQTQCLDAAAAGGGKQRCLRLRLQRSELSARCFKAVFASTARTAVASDIRTRPTLVAACQRHIADDCHQHDDSARAVMACLRSLPKAVVSHECEAEVRA